MRIEAILAIIIGVLLGLGITFGVYKLRQQAPDETSVVSLTTPTPSPVPVNEKLLITSPIDEAILASTDLRISGSAEPNEMIVLLVNDDEYITQADSIGAFAQDVTLESGGNIIDVVTINRLGSQEKETLHVVVSTTSLDEPVASTATESAEAPTPTQAKEE